MEYLSLNQVEYEDIKISIQQFIKLKPYRGQYANGKTLINKGHLKKLRRGNILDALYSITNPVVLYGKTVDTSIVVSGNHRKVVTDERVLEGSLSEETVFPVRRITTELTPAQLSRIAAEANSTARVNGKSAAVHGDLPICYKMYKPVFDGLRRIKFVSSLKGERLEQLSMLLVGLFNNNKVLVDNLRMGRHLDITASQLYKARTYPEAHIDEYFRQEANYDLRGLEDKIAVLFAPGVKLIDNLRSLNLWKETLGRNTNLEYVFYTASAKGLISSKDNDPGKITIKKAHTVFHNKKGKLNNLMTKYFVNHPDSTEESLIDLFVNPTKAK